MSPKSTPKRYPDLTFPDPGEGTFLGPSLEPLQNTSECPGTLQEPSRNPPGTLQCEARKLSKQAPEKSPQNDVFLHPACKAKVSSRLDGSTVFTVSPGPLLAPILEQFWHPFGRHMQ